MDDGQRDKGAQVTTTTRNGVELRPCLATLRLSSQPRWWPRRGYVDRAGEGGCRRKKPALMRVGVHRGEWVQVPHARERAAESC